MNVNGDDGNDLIGNGYVSLLPLLENKVIKERVQVVKGAQKMGFIDVKIFWHDAEEAPSKVNEKKGGVDKEVEIGKIQDGINKFMAENRVEAADIFKMIDRNRSDMISFNEFESWVRKIVPDSKLTTINEFYNSFRQPLNELNFASRLTQQQTINSEIALELGIINQLVNKNTTLIQPKVSLQ